MITDRNLSRTNIWREPIVQGYIYIHTRACCATWAHGQEKKTKVKLPTTTRHVIVQDHVRLTKVDKSLVSQ